MRQASTNICRHSSRGSMEKVQLERSTRRSAERLRRRLGRPGVDDVEVVALADEDLLAVGRQLEVPDVLDERLGLDVAVLDLDGLELGLARGARSPVDEEQGFFADGKPGIDAGRERDLEDAVLDAGEVDDDLRRRRLGRFLGRLSGRRPRLGFGPLSRRRLPSFRAWSSVAGAKGNVSLAVSAGGVDLGRLVEVGLGLARSPRAAHGAPEVAVREEVEPLAVRAPGRTVGIDAVVGELRGPCRSRPRGARSG